MVGCSQTPPGPGLGSFHQPGTQGVAFDIATHGVEVVVALNGKRLVGSLVQVPVPDTVPKQAPATHVRRGQTLHEAAQLAVGARPEEQVPVIGHQAPGKNPHGHFVGGFTQHAQKGEVVPLGLEQLPALIASIEDVIDDSAGRYASRSWHAYELIARHCPSQ